MGYYRELRVIVILRTRKCDILYAELACTHVAGRDDFTISIYNSFVCFVSAQRVGLLMRIPQLQHGTASTATLGTPGPSRSMS